MAKNQINKKNWRSDYGQVLKLIMFVKHLSHIKLESHQSCLNATDHYFSTFSDTNQNGCCDSLRAWLQVQECKDFCLFLLLIVSLGEYSKQLQRPFLWGFWFRVKFLWSEGSDHKFQCWLFCKQMCYLKATGHE